MQIWEDRLNMDIFYMAETTTRNSGWTARIYWKRTLSILKGKDQYGICRNVLLGDAGAGKGNYQFDWLEKVIDSLYAEGISTILSTPSGARPKWLSDKYPEVLRVNEKREKNLFGGRHNHCFTSPVYREKVAEIDRRLGEKFGKHPGVILWHISTSLAENVIARSARRSSGSGWKRNMV